MKCSSVELCLLYCWVTRLNFYADCKFFHWFFSVIFSIAIINDFITLSSSGFSIIIIVPALVLYFAHSGIFLRSDIFKNTVREQVLSLSPWLNSLIFLVVCIVLNVFIISFFVFADSFYLSAGDWVFLGFGIFVYGIFAALYFTPRDIWLANSKGFSSASVLSAPQAPIAASDSVEGASASFLISVSMDISRLRRQCSGLLGLCMIIATYAAFQAASAISIADRGAQLSNSISEIQQRIADSEAYIRRAVDATDFSNELQVSRYQALRTEYDSLIERDQAALAVEIARVDAESGEVDGQFLFDYFSSFFVRLASVAISLGFFTIVFYQFRRSDRQRAELEIIKLAYIMYNEGVSYDGMSSTRKSLAISDYIPSRKETDAFTAFGAATIGTVPDMIAKLGVAVPGSPKEVQPDTDAVDPDSIDRAESEQIDSVDTDALDPDRKST